MSVPRKLKNSVQLTKKVKLNKNLSKAEEKEAKALRRL